MKISTYSSVRWWRHHPFSYTKRASLILEEPSLKVLKTVTLTTGCLGIPAASRRPLRAARPCCQSGQLLLARRPSTQPFGQELLPRPAAHGLLGSQVGAGPEHACGLARQPERHDQPTPMSGPKVPAEQLGGAVHPRPTHVGHPAGRLAECELDEPGSYLISVDGLDPEAGRKRYHR